MKKLAIAVLALAALIAAITLLPIGSWIEWLVRTIRGTGLLGVIGFGLAFEIVTLTLLPTVELFVASGMIYGFWWGSVMSMAVSFSAALIAFALGRTILRDRIERFAKRHERLANVDHALGEHAFVLTLLLRVTPAIPLGPLNYVLAAGPISWRTYIAASFLGMLPGHLLWAYLGSALHSVSQLGHAAHGTWSQVLLWATIAGTLALTGLLTYIVKHALSRYSVRDR